MTDEERIVIAHAPRVAGLAACGCCAGPTVSTPSALYNRPGLDAVAYRIGTQPSFKETMLARLSASKFAALTDLRVRRDDDFTVALLDAWATAADVLTFYQERIANESYLRTATERISIQHLARLLGYELRPGVAAATPLAFTLEDAPGSPRRTPLVPGIKVQSVPGPDETPQTFETVETIDARVEWNALRPRPTVPRQPVAGDEVVHFKGTLTGLERGDVLLFVGSERRDSAASNRWDIAMVVKVDVDHGRDRTRVGFTPATSGRTSRCWRRRTHRCTWRGASSTSIRRRNTSRMRRPKPLAAPRTRWARAPSRALPTRRRRRTASRRPRFVGRRGSAARSVVRVERSPRSSRPHTLRSRRMRRSSARRCSARSARFSRPSRAERSRTFPTTWRTYS
ncbi:MAG: hypothetical protein HYU41_25885 [Candidatus Rokubacteria bacterium]|nr:hypothetical protein [Candidatus Rokubacteria bacterium]